MLMEDEITVKVTSDYETLHNELVKNGFKLLEEYDLDDTYLINKDIDINNMDNYEILKKCALIREVGENKKTLTYKYKEFNEDGSIKKQGKVDCPITDAVQALYFMKAINYRELFKIHDHIIVYVKEDCELAVQLVNDEYIFIEMESSSDHIDRVYNSVDELKEELDSYNLSYDKSDYFCKKALIMLEKIKQPK